MESLINIGIILTYLMVGFAALTAIGFGVKKMIANTENTKKTLYTIVGLVIVVVFSYLIASNEVLGSFEKYEISNFFHTDDSTFSKIDHHSVWPYASHVLTNKKKHFM